MLSGHVFKHILKCVSHTAVFVTSILIFVFFYPNKFQGGKHLSEQTRNYRNLPYSFSKGGVGCASSVTTPWLTLRTMAAFKRIHWQWPQVHWKLRQKKQKNETTQVQLVICEIGMQLDVFLKTNRFPCHNGSLWRHMAKYTSYPFSILHQTRVFIVLCTLTYITDWLLMYSTYHYLKAHLRKRQSIELKW